MNRIRRWLLTWLAGDDTVIINADIVGTVYPRKQGFVAGSTLSESTQSVQAEVG